MRWVPIATLEAEALPNVMRKAIAHGLESGRAKLQSEGHASRAVDDRRVRR